MTYFSARRSLAAGVLTGGLLLLNPLSAQAHSLDSSTLSVRVGDDSVDTTVTVAFDTLTRALGAENPSADQVISYFDEHLSVTGADGSPWKESWSNVAQQSVEGIDSLSVDVTLDPAGADPGGFTLTYDAIIDADSTHEAVVVLTDAAGDISTAGVLNASSTSLQIGDVASTGLVDMVSYGLHHVLGGADHLLFLLTLLLVAPCVMVAGRWQRGDGLAPTVRRVLGVITAFTVGHSLTLIASAVGWVSVPRTPVEVLIALSVGIAAVHVVRPLARRGELVIAGGFGLVHGLAFAGILTDLGLGGSASMPALLAFNVGVELAQLMTVALVFPSLYLLSRTRYGRVSRWVGAAVALVAALAWALDRLGVLTDPLAGTEQALIDHPWWVVLGLALVAGACWLPHHRNRTVGREHPGGATGRSRAHNPVQTNW